MKLPHESFESRFLGEVPESWKIVRVRRLTQKHKQGYYTEQAYVEEGVKLVRITDIDDFANVSFEKMPFVPISPKDERAFMVEDGDFLFARSGTIGRFGLVRNPERSVFTSYLIRFKFKNINPDFLRFAFSSYSFRESLISTLHGGANKNVHAENIKEQLVAIPPFAQQKSIAQFLDLKTAAIDALIAKKQRLIELLEEKRSAFINQAVTKGLNPDAPMKDSGISWIGQIPEHWEVLQLKRAFVLQRGVDITKEQQTEGEVPVVSSGGISSYHNVAIAKAPGVVIGRKGTLGKVYYLDRDYWAHDTTLYVIEFYKNFPRFIFYKLRSMNLESWDTGSANPTLNRNLIHPLKISFPPKEEQIEIANFLDSQSVNIDQVISKIKDQINRLQEYRQSVITAAVTGKLDVTQEEIT